MSKYGDAAVRAALRSSPHAFKAADFEQMKVADATATMKLSKPPPSVFAANSEWASPSTCAVLDDLHSQNDVEASNSEEGKAKLAFMRRAGSMMQDGNDADLFETENVRGTGPRSAFRTFLVECKHCRRPVLGTRFVDHLKQCSKCSKASSFGTDAVDPELNLVVSPYVSKPSSSCKYKTSENQPSGDNVAVNLVSLPYFSKSTSEVGALRKRGFQWRKRISPLAPIRKARGGRLSTFGKVALVPFMATPTPKKKHSTPDRRTNAAANSVGLGSTDKDDELAFAGGSWGLSAQWAKLTQCCRPIVVPRSELRKNTLTRETPLSIFCKLPNSNQFLHADTVNSKMVPRSSNTRVTKALSRNLPSLPGAILHVRGKYSKKLQATDLGKLDISSTSIPKAIYMYHGQSFFANPGQFFSDHRSPSEVKLPTSVVDTGFTVPIRGGNLNALNTLNPQQAQALAQQQRSAGAASAPATPQEPPAKRQRVSKARANTPLTSSGIPPKQPLPQQRKVPQARPAQTNANQKQRNAILQQHIAQQQHHQRQINAGNNAAAVAVSKRAQSRPTTGNRQLPGAGNFAIPPSAINPHQIAAASKPAAVNGGARGNSIMRSNVVGQHGNVQAQNMIHQNAMLNAFQTAGLQGQVAPNVNMRANPGGMATADYEAILRGVGASAAMPQSPMNYNTQAQKAQKTQKGARALTAARNQHQQNINLRAQNQGQAGQPPVNPAVQAQMIRQAQQLRNMRGAQGASLRQQFNQSQKRPANVQTSSALSGRSGGSTAAPVFAEQQNGPMLFNSGFSVAVPPTHERNGSNKTTPIQANAANLAYMQMMQNTSSSGVLGAQMANGNTTSPAAIAALQQFGQGVNVQGGNMFNYLQGQNASANNMSQQVALQNMARIAGRPAVGENIMSTLMTNAQHNNIMHGMQGNKSNTPIIATPSSVNNTAPSTSEALNEIDKALSLM